MEELEKCSGVRSEDNWLEILREWRVGNDGKTKLWEDTWVHVENLASRFPGMYLNSLQQHMSVKDMGVWRGGSRYGISLGDVSGLFGSSPK